MSRSSSKTTVADRLGRRAHFVSASSRTSKELLAEGHPGCQHVLGGASRQERKHRVMRKLQCVALVLACLHPGCIWEDNGTHLAYALERGAKHLKESNSLEEGVHYEPLTGTAQTYYIEIFPSTSLP